MFRAMRAQVGEQIFRTERRRQASSDIDGHEPGVDSRGIERVEVGGQEPPVETDGEFSIGAPEIQLAAVRKEPQTDTWAISPITA